MSAHGSQNKVSDPHEAAVTGSRGLPKKVLGAKLWSLASELTLQAPILLMNLMPTWPWRL